DAAARRHDLHVRRALDAHLELKRAVAHPGKVCVRVDKAGYDHLAARVEALAGIVAGREFIRSANLDNQAILDRHRAVLDHSQRAERLPPLRASTRRGHNAHLVRILHQQIDLLCHSYPVGATLESICLQCTIQPRDRVQGGSIASIRWQLPSIIQSRRGAYADTDEGCSVGTGCAKPHYELHAQRTRAALPQPLPRYTGAVPRAGDRQVDLRAVWWDVLHRARLSARRPARAGFSAHPGKEHALLALPVPPPA